MAGRSVGTRLPADPPVVSGWSIRRKGQVEPPSTTGMASDTWLGGTLMALVGLGFLAWAVTHHRTQTRLLTETRRTQGVVEETGVRCGDGSYHPQVRYRYEFEGETYESDGIYPANSSPTESSSAAVYRTFEDLGIEEGARTTVFVNPDHPDDGFLVAERTTHRNALFAVVGAGLVCLGGFLLATDLGLVHP